MSDLLPVAIGLTGLSLGAYLLSVAVATVMILRARRRLRGTMPRPREAKVSILKPLAGMDDDLLANLESFAALEGARYEVLLGVASVDDPAVPAAREFLRRHPELDARLVITDPDAALNPKVAQLVGLERAATGDVIVISDSNVRVGPRYLVHLLDSLSEPGVGLVSSIVVGTGERSLGAAVENLLIATHVTPGVLSGYALTGRAITIGKSMAMRRDDLRRVGGFARVADVLAEDHAFARIFAAEGMGVGVCLDAVENRNVGCSVRRSIERHTRWAKIRRAMAPAGFALEPLLLPVVVATAGFLVAPTRTTLLLLAGVAVAQVLAAWWSMWLLRGRALPWHLAPLEIGRSFLLLACWARAWVSRRVCWRGHTLRVGRNTVLEAASPGALARVWAYVRG